MKKGKSKKEQQMRKRMDKGKIGISIWWSPTHEQCYNSSN